jgi:hypothetical protein
MARKTLSIGITINLENYENLRLDVEGEVGDDGDAEELISFLDGMLARLGHGDQVTAERVEAYRRRVLAFPKAVVAAVPGPVRREEEASPVTVRPASVGGPREAAPRIPDPVQAEARKEAASAPAREEQPVTVRVNPEGKAAKSASKAPARAEGAVAPPGAARVPEPRKVPATQPPKEAVKEAAKPEKPPVAEGEVACEGCGLSITKNQEKLSRLLTGKSLCKRCMNPT